MVAGKATTTLRELWRGEKSLPVAFWRYLVTFGFAINLGTTLVALAIILAEGPIVVAMLIHVLPVPYVVLAAVGTWRSANRYTGSPALAVGAQIFALAWVLLTIVL